MILKSFAELPARKRLGIVAVLLGVIAIFADDPTNNASTMVNIKEISLLKKDNISSIHVDNLADWIIKGRYDYRLVDLRNEENFLKYRIPSAENIPVNQLLESDLAKNEKIILYSDNDIESSQAWFILTSNKYQGVNVLQGGIENWKQKILFPACTCGDNPTPEQVHKHNKLAEVSKFFGGKIQTNKIATSSQKLEMPEIALPATINLKKTSGKKKREGC